MSTAIPNWLQLLLLKRRANRIACAVMEECWAKVRGKAAMLPASDRADYVRPYAALFVQRQVDVLVREAPTIQGPAANKLIVLATARLVSRLLQRLPKQVRRPPRAA